VPRPDRDPCGARRSGKRLSGRTEPPGPKENPGDGLLSRRLRSSTIGAEGLNFSVRNGKRWVPLARVTGNSVDS
jgi:hypothetical protein